MHNIFPTLSVITVTYNAVRTVEATINSVLNQKDDSVEYWIIDGNSSDGTLDIIKKYEDRITGWISEPDSGIYDAMNKGLNKSKGNWIFFLGADDNLLPNAINKLKVSIKNDLDLVFGRVRLSNGRIVKSFLNKRTVFQNTLHHQSALYNRRLFSNFQYDSSLKILSDYELNLLLYLRKSNYLEIENILVVCSENGASSNISLSIYETNIIRSRHINNKLINKVLSNLLKLYYLQKDIRSRMGGKKNENY